MPPSVWSMEFACNLIHPGILATDFWGLRDETI
jgi:hypothetical protein